MKTGVYFCKCGTIISERIDSETVKAKVLKHPDLGYFKTIEFMCSEEGKEFLERDLKEEMPDRVVIAACSPREHESTFRRVLSKAGINPYLMQMVNIREHLAWVTTDIKKASDKAAVHIWGAVERVKLHEPLEKKEIEPCPDVLIIGAGPAGLKAALSIAESDRKVVLVEKTPVIGGMPFRYEEIFPSMECGSCMLEPMVDDVLHGGYSENIEIMTLSEVVEVSGYYGNFIIKIKQSPRYVDIQKCIGCGECIEPCPVSTRNEFNCDMDKKKAIAFPYIGSLPNVPFIDRSTCLHFKGEECQLCKDSCPIGKEVINLDEKGYIFERNAGAIIVAIGASLYDCKDFRNLVYGDMPDVYTSLEFEIMLSSNGPTGGEIKTSKETHPESVAIIHCVGSLEKAHKEYCSGICCMYAFKFNNMIEKELPGTKIYHLYKELVFPGKDEFSLYKNAKGNPNSMFIRYENNKDLNIYTDKEGKKIIEITNTHSDSAPIKVDMVILCPAVVPSEGSEKLSAILDISIDRFGFFEELHGLLDSAQSKIKGIYIAGACQSPMDIQKAMNQAMAAAGYVLSGLVPGRKLEIEPINAFVNDDRCSGCRLCMTVCPYKAIAFDTEKNVAEVNAILCHGCGTCVSACPSGAMDGNHFTTKEIIAEIEGLLA